MRDDDLTGPVRTRGPARLDVKDSRDLVSPVRTRGGLRLETSSETSTAVRRRGAVRTRGAVKPPAPPRGGAPVETLSDLMKDLREATGGMPLTILVHGSESAASQEFVRTLYPRCQRDDALWLTGAGGSVAQPSAELDAATTLDLTDDTDRRIHDNLVCDLVFFPAIGIAELADVDQWRRRTSALVADVRGDQARKVVAAGRRAGLRTYRWLGEEALSRSSQ